MAESETDCDTPGLDTLGSECVIAHTQVGDLHYGAETEIMTQEDKRLDLEAIHGDLGAVTCVDVVTETDHDYIKSEIHHDHHQYFSSAEIKGNEHLLGEVLLKTEIGGGEHIVKVESDHGGELTVESENGVIIHEAHGLQCSECGEIFGCMSDLHEHFEIHKATHPYICVHCGESFAVEASLRSHMRIHMKEKSYTTGLEMVGRNLSYIPSSIPSSIQTLDFSFNVLKRLRKTVFPVLSFLRVLDLSRFQFYLQYCCILLRGYRSPGQQECSYDAFVIFSSYDEVWVMNELMENLENGVPPIQLCLHMRDFQAGKSIASNIIDEGIMGSRKIIVVVSQHFIDSAWCRFEFELAQSRFMMERNANIIIIILEDVEERKTKKVLGLHKHLKKNTYLKWSRDPLSNMRFWIRLRKAIIATNQ
ncbi:zinc finger protein 501-like [Labeo rohita]|uniref:Zinc finger protein 501-like n=1 Tax=Labeo rohita TaxID=84645 RepID=A0A498MYB0_LABRO|nr:zinc finger protein 501-like [Labeo rohita]